MRLALPFALPDRRRATSFVLALAVEALLILLLLLFGPHFTPTPSTVRRPTSFSLSPSPDKEAASAPEHRSRTREKAAASGAAPPTPQIKPIVVPPPKTPTPPNPLPGVLPIQLGAADISKLKSSATNDDGSGADAGTDSKLAYGPGEGPGGQPLYNAEWYREPSNAELNGYLPHGAPPNSWALIACQTVPKFHVENCRSLGESPAGSGLARSMREAAWQFLVRPPRRGGKVLVGAWVRIRIDFTLRPTKSDKDDQPPAQ